MGTHTSSVGIPGAPYRVPFVPHPHRSGIVHKGRLEKLQSSTAAPEFLLILLVAGSSPAREASPAAFHAIQKLFDQPTAANYQVETHIVRYALKCLVAQGLLKKGRGGGRGAVKATNT